MRLFEDKMEWGYCHSSNCPQAKKWKWEKHIDLVWGEILAAFSFFICFEYCIFCTNLASIINCLTINGKITHVILLLYAPCYFNIEWIFVWQCFCLKNGDCTSSKVLDCLWYVQRLKREEHKSLYEIICSATSTA